VKQNLLFINSITVYGGGEVWMINSVNEFIKRGYNVTLVCKHESEILHHAKKSGIDVVPERIAGEGDPVTIFKLVYLLSNRKIDLIITNTAKELRLSGIASKIAGRCKVIARQGIDFPLKNKLRYRFTYNKLADAIVANSEATKKTILRNAPWLKPEKIKVIYNGINPDNYSTEKTKSLRDEFGFTRDDLIIGFVGRLSVQKGIKYMLEAFRIVSQKFDNIKLLIVGKGELEKFIIEFINENNLQKKILLGGFREDIPDIMRTIDVLLLPSLWEGFGIVLIEAMASGKPCVATDISSIPEIISDGLNGFLVPPENSEGLAKALINLISNKELAEKFEKEGLQIVNERFTMKRMADEYEKLFLQMIL
jgi:glycosyltransferase involved in cell wall biosynthesis